MTEGQRGVIRNGLVRALVVLGLLVGALEGQSWAGSFHVANYGADSDICGPAGDPCRSVSRAIQNASAGARIIVHPGRYGDLNQDGLFDPTAGEEAAEDNTGCACMIKIDKRVTIESSAGAGVTLLDAGGGSERVVRILAEADGAVFGKATKGFTLTGSADFGLVIDAGTTGVQVGGNLGTTTNLEAFSVAGSGHTLTGNLAQANAGEGFVVDGSDHKLTGNVASGNAANGFRLVVTSSQNTFTRNAATGNGQAGFRVSGTEHTFTGNGASSNAAEGFRVFDTDHTFASNTAVGNGGSGIRLAPAASASVKQTNLYGNDPTNNCGLLNESGNTVDATKNFWGAATGPGDNPADRVCDVGSTTTVAPFAGKELSPKKVSLF